MSTRTCPNTCLYTQSGGRIDPLGPQGPRRCETTKSEPCLCVDMCVDMRVDLCVDMRVDIRVAMRVYMRGAVPVNICPDLLMERCIDMCVDMLLGRHTCTETCATAVCIDMRIATCTDAYGHVHRLVYMHLYRRVYRHMHRHVARSCRAAPRHP